MLNAALHRTLSGGIAGAGGLLGEFIEAEDGVARGSAGTQLSSFSQGKKIVLMTNGTRGDCQPVIALGCYLKESGFDIMVTSNVNHASFIEKFGLKVGGCHASFEDLLEVPAIKKAMTEGQIMSAMGEATEYMKKAYPDGVKRQWQFVKDFKPDLILAHLNDIPQGNTFAQVLKIPCGFLGLFPFVPSTHAKSLIGEPCCHYGMWLLIMRLLYGMDKDSKVSTLRELVKEEVPFDEFWGPDFVTHMTEHMAPLAPNIIGLSSIINPLPPDIPTSYSKMSHLTGYWVIDKEEQSKRLKRQDSKFGGKSLGPLQDFLNDGDAPVYIGWGSMMHSSPEYMACLAVRSLMKAELRGIIVGGWAQLEPKHIEGQPDTPKMKEYIEKNVLFVATAPHEWLFPQTVATVHHGGAGTLAAALRAGVPTIVTPFAIDQFDNADLVRKSGAGFGLKQISKVTPAVLGAALKQCVSDKVMIERAMTLGKELRNEDGLKVAAQAIDKFFVEEVGTGQFAAKMERRLAERRAAVKSPPSCFAFLVRAMCGKAFK